MGPGGRAAQRDRLLGRGDRSLVARGLVAGDRQLDAGEFLDLHIATVDELQALCAEGDVTDGKTLVGLLWLQNWQAGRWPITWQDAGAMAGAP